MPELFWAQGGVRLDFWGLKAGVCQNYCRVRGGYAGTFVGSGGSMPELLWAQGGGYAGTFGGLGGGMPELLWAHRRVCRNI